MQYLLSLSLSDMTSLTLKHYVYYKNATGNIREDTCRENNVVCLFCEVSVHKDKLYRHRIACHGLPEVDRVESDSIVTRYSSQRAIRHKLSKYCVPDDMGRVKYAQTTKSGRMVKQRWPVAFVKYIKAQTRNLPNGEGHDVRMYFQWWNTKDYTAMPVLRNTDMYVYNYDCKLAG